jgi:hypothetical protein
MNHWCIFELHIVALSCDNYPKHNWIYASGYCMHCGLIIYEFKELVQGWIKVPKRNLRLVLRLILG